VLAELVTEQNDATLAEYAERLAERAGVRRSLLAAVCRALKGLGLARRKDAPGRRAGPG
jgi:transposase